MSLLLKWLKMLLTKYYKILLRFQDHFVKEKLQKILKLFYLIDIILIKNQNKSGHQEVIIVQEIKISYKKYFW